jgi:hypothetical protein
MITYRTQGSLLSLLEHLRDVVEEGAWLACYVAGGASPGALVLLAEVQEASAFLRLQFDQLIGHFFEASVHVVEVLEAGKVLAQVLRRMLQEQLLHLDQDVEGTDQVRILRVEGLRDSGRATHDDTEVMPLLD